MSPVAPLVLGDPPVVDSSSSDQVKGDILSQVNGLFDSFAKSLEAHFANVEHRVNEVASSRDLPSTLAAHVAELSSDRDVSDQDLTNLTPSFSAPRVVAGCSEPTPDGVPSAPYSGGLGTYPGGPPATDALSGATSLPLISFESLLTAVRVLESSGRVPDSFLEALWGSVVFSVEHNFTIGGESLAESICSFRSRLCDPVSPLPGPSKGGNSIAQFLCSLVVSPPQLPPRSLGRAMFT